ncbi:serine hydrolase domain-containing protein [Caulobacter sp. KR2-114]|uniref:serine hydrolase domain-containing protein n=1 Tax=Caulobacter sp. KR2-114 TaxID=3400912 RepID=UPI003C007BF1
MRLLAAALLLAAPASRAQPVPPPAGPVATAPAASPPAPHPVAAHPPAPAAAAAAAPQAPARPGARLAPGQDMPPAELEAFVDGVVRQAMTRDHIAGAAVAVVQHGQVLLKKGYGAADFAPYRPVDPDRTLFRLGPVSNAFTWILVLRQAEAGRMRLDARVNQYLPDALRIRDQGYSRPITLLELMNHTAGFEDRALGQLVERDEGRVRPLATYLRQERPRRVREPGAAVSYSNYGVALAGEAVSEVSGKPFETLVEDQITGPLGLAHTSFREPHGPATGLPAPLAPALAGDLSRGFRWTTAGYRLRSAEYWEQVGPATGGSASVGDMSRFMLALLGNGSLDGVTIYGEPTAIAFSSPQPTPARGLPAWRHGLLETALPGDFGGVGLGGATLSFHTNMVLVPELGLGVFVTGNTDSAGALVSALPAHLVQRFYAGPPPALLPGSNALIADRQAFEGVYLNDRRAWGGLEGFVTRLLATETVRISDNGKLLVRGADVGGVWSLDGAPARGWFASDDGPQRLVFDRRDGGRAGRFFAPWGGLTFERVGFLGQAAALAWMTTLALVASLATLGGVVMRARRDFRETSGQRRASLLQSSQAILWIVAAGLFGGWAMNVRDPAQMMYDWPGWNLLLASACALVAAIMAVVSLVFIPLVWRGGGRRLDSWTAGRKARFTVTALIFAGYAVLLGFWGALEPWTG